MSERRKSTERINVFGDDMNDLKAVADDIYGPPAEPGLDTGRVVAKPTDIHDIRPDPQQPRRVMPSAVRNVPLPPAVTNAVRWRMLYWMRAALSERIGATMMDKDPIIEFYRAVVTGEKEMPEPAGLIEKSLLHVVDLAATIRRDGLINPISIVRAPVEVNGCTIHWMVETGERRWLAHHLLTVLGFEGFERIAAVQKSAMNVWAQASENTQRSDLNAIGRARQFAILLMDLLREEGETFEPLEAFQIEQDYYAQVADSRVPTGSLNKLLSALGFSARQSANDYQQLLRLPAAFWIKGDDEDWSKTDLLKVVVDSKIVRATDNFGINSPIQTKNMPSDLPDNDSDSVPPPVGEGENNPNIATPPTVTSHRDEEDIPAHDDRAGLWPRMGDEVVTRNGHVGKVTFVVNAGVLVRVKTGYGESLHKVETLRRPDDALARQSHVESEHISEPSDGFKIGDRVLMGGRTPGTIRYIKNGRYGVFFDHSRTTHYYNSEDLTPLLPDQVGSNIEEPANEPQPARFQQPFSLEYDSVGPWIRDANVRLVARWTPVQIAPQESVQWLEWLLMLGNVFHLYVPVQRLFALVEYIEGEAPDDYLPGDAMAAIELLQEFLADAAETVRRDMDEVK